MQASKLYPGAVFKGIRGNVVTRLRKLDDGEYDALILAAAGLLRMGYGERISRYFSVDEILPSAGQGIMAVQGRGDDGNVSFIERVNSTKSRAMATAERAFVRILDGGCSSPSAACAEVKDGRILLRGLYYDERTDSYIKGTAEDTLGNEEELGVELALSLRKKFTEGNIKS